MSYEVWLMALAERETIAILGGNQWFATEEPSMSEVNPFARFPEMTPIQATPSLGLVNGIGLNLYGRRGSDDETNTYVKTHVFCVFYLPIFGLGAYRVHDAPGGGWYFIGKVPLSPLVKIWNLLMCLLIFGGGGFLGWTGYTETEGYKAGVKIAEAQKLAREGSPVQAAESYRQVIYTYKNSKIDAEMKLRDLITAPTNNLGEMAKVYGIVAELLRQRMISDFGFAQAGVKLCTEQEKNDPAGTMAVLEVIEPHLEKNDEVQPMQQRLLEQLTKEQPGEVRWASKLAAIYDKQDENAARCEQLLAPHAEKLTDQDGAAVLGRILLNKGELTKSEPVLSRFVELRLPHLERAWNELDSAFRQIGMDLDQQRAFGFDYDAFNRADDEQKRELFQEYAAKQPAYRTALRGLVAQSRVTQAAMDLGLTRLLLAQKAGEPALRENWLKKAEEAFLSVKKQAGNSNEYRLRLAQVSYWLGKEPEAKKLFEEVLKQNNRVASDLLAVGHIYREVGVVSQARALFEEAYATKDEKMQQAAARARTLVYTDLDDHVLWLERSKGTDPESKAELLHIRGKQAQLKNQQQEAIKLFREALLLREKLPESSSTLNNSALIHFSLFAATQDPADFRLGMEKMDRAVQLQPEDSILLMNIIPHILQATLRDLLAAEVDFKVLKRGAGMDLLSFLYADHATRAPLIAQLEKHPGYAKIKTYSEKLMLLAPKSSESYAILFSLAGWTGNLVDLRALEKRLESITLDLRASKTEIVDFITGKRDARLLEETKAALERRTQILTEARKIGKITLAVAADQLVDTKIESVLMGQNVDAEEMLKLAEEADKAQSSSGTRSTLSAALLHRIHRRLVTTNAEYAAIAEKTKRTLGSSVIYWALHEEDWRKILLADPEMKRLIEIKRAGLNAFPEACDPWSATLLIAAQAEDAEMLKKKCLGDEKAAIKRSIGRKLWTLKPTQALEEFLVLRLQGKTKEANEVLAKLEKEGLPMPKR
jgi:tetratricopeptide (TPR) repeat protein